MRNILLNLYYDNSTLIDAIEFVQRCYDKTPSDKIINSVKEEIKKCTNKDWN